MFFYNVWILYKALRIVQQYFIRLVRPEKSLEERSSILLINHVDVQWKAIKMNASQTFRYKYRTSKNAKMHVHFMQRAIDNLHCFFLVCVD